MKLDDRSCFLYPWPIVLREGMDRGNFEAFAHQRMAVCNNSISVVSSPLHLLLYVLLFWHYATTQFSRKLNVRTFTHPFLRKHWFVWGTVISETVTCYLLDFINWSTEKNLSVQKWSLQGIVAPHYDSVHISKYHHTVLFLHSNSVYSSLKFYFNDMFLIYSAF